MNEGELVQAYRQTSYWVETNEISVRIRVGELNPLLDKLLNDCGVVEWSHITAANPDSIVYSDEENHKAHLELCRQSLGLGYKTLSGHGTADNAHWPSEESLLILGINRSVAKTLGERFGQKAIVVGEIGRPAELLILQKSTLQNGRDRN